MILNNKKGFAITVMLFLSVLVNSAFASIAPVTPETTEQVRSPEENYGDRYFNQGFYEKAIRSWREVYKEYRANQDLAGQIGILYKISTAQRMLGLHDRSIRGLEVASKLSSLLNDASLSLMINANLGGAYLYTGQFELAKPLLVETLNRAEKSGNKRLTSLIYNDLGNFYSFTGQTEKAFETFYKSGDIAIAIRDSYLVVQALTNAINLATDENRFDTALVDLERAVNFVAQLKPSYQKAYGMEKVGGVAYRLLEKHQPEDKSSFYSIVNQLTEQASFAEQIGNDWLVAKLLLLEAGYYEYAQLYEDALRLAEKAVFHSQLINDSNLIYQIEWKVARINEHLSNDGEAATFYRRAIETVQPIRQALYQNPAYLSGQETRQDNIYLEFADLLLRNASNTNQAGTKMELLFEARNVLERQKSEELQDYFKNQCVVEAQSKTIRIDQAIDNNTAVIYPVLLPDRTELLVSYNNKIDQYVVNKSERYVTEQVRNLRLKLEKKRTRDYLPFARELYQILISPLEAELSAQGINTLVFIPGQSLRTIPVSVLHDGKQFLIDKYAVATTPGLSLTDPRPLKRKNMKVLLSGLSEPVQGYPPLDYVQGELEQIQNLYGAKMLMNQSFDKTNISHELQDTNYSVAHFASHAEFSGDVSNSFILTFDDRLSVSQLGQYVSIGQYKNKPIELLTLSACNTA
ncbi:CHAT domain-containing protein, partial [Kaarinaea lacus]